MKASEATIKQEENLGLLSDYFVDDEFVNDEFEFDDSSSSIDIDATVSGAINLVDSTNLHSIKKPYRKNFLSTDRSSDESISFEELEEAHRQRKSFGYELVNNCLEDIGCGHFQKSLLFIVAFGKFVDASETNMMSMLYPIMLSEWGVNETELAVVGSFTSIGMMIGALQFGQVSDTYGRKAAYQVSLIILAVFGFLSSFAIGVYSFACMRLIMGIGYGGNLIACTALLVEFIPSKERGFYSNLTGFAYTAGSMMVTAGSWVLIPVIGWRWMVRSLAIFAVPVIWVMFYIPESTRFYVMRNRFHEAVESMQIVAAKNGKPLPDYFTVEALRASHHAPPSGKGAWARCTGYGELWQRGILVTLVPLSSVWFFYSFASSIGSWIPMEMKKYFAADTNVVYQLSFATTCFHLVGSINSLVCILYFKRITLIRVGLVVASLFTFALGLCRTHVALYVVLFCHTVGVNMAISTLCVYSPEVFPTNIRVTAFGFVQFCHRLAPAIGPYAIAFIDYEDSFTVTCMVFGMVYLLAAFSAMFLSVVTFNAPLVEEEDIKKG